MHSDQVLPSTSSIIFLLEFHQAGMGKVERDGDAGHIGRTEPFVRYPGVRLQPDSVKLFIQRAATILEPGAFDPNPQAAKALLEQLLIRQLLPGVFPTRHRHP
jgi:hypothetical protein